MIELTIRHSRGRGKNGKKHVWIRPDYYCFNKSRSASGFDNKELDESIATVMRKWYLPALTAYKVNGETIVSNNEKNALIEYWRVCEKVDIGEEFRVQIIEQINLPAVERE